LWLACDGFPLYWKSSVFVMDYRGTFQTVDLYYCVILNGLNMGIKVKQLVGQWKIPVKQIFSIALFESISG